MSKGSFYETLKRSKRLCHLYQGFKTVLRVSTVTSAGHNVQTGVLNSALTISTIIINTCSGETTVQAKRKKKDRKEKKNAVIIEQFVSANTIKFLC